MTLKAQVLKSLKWTTTSAIVCAVLQVARMAILARLIAREDFGLFATIAVILGFADFFVEAGLGSAVIHKQDATKEDLASAYTINVVIGWLVFGVLYCASTTIAGFYDDDRLINLLRLATLVFLCQPLGRQYDALLRRDLQFNIIAKLDIFSAVCGFILSILLAWRGLGVKALIYSQLLITLVRTIILLAIGSKHYGFNIGFSWQRARFFFRFGAFQICESSINYFNAQLDTILIGKFLGQETLGVFFMAKQLAFKPLEIINPIIGKISLPVFAKMQKDEARLKRGYLHVVHTLASIHFALFTIIAGFSEEIISIFLGSDWAMAGSLLKILAFYTMLRAIGGPVGGLLIAKGRVDLGFYWNLGLFLYTPPIIIFASQWGPKGIAWGLLLAMLGANIPSWYFLVRKLCGATFSEYFGALFNSFCAATLCFGPLFLIASFYHKVIVCIISLSFYTHWKWQNRKNSRI